MPDASSIPNLVADSFQDSLDRQLIHLYDYESTSKIPLESPATTTTEGGTQFIHVVPGLASKPAVPLHTPDLTKLTKRDPFEGPEYGPGEKVMDLESSDGSPYALVHNMYALMKEHFMAIPHFDDKNHPFRPQTSQLSASDLEIAHLVVSSYRQKGRDLICFFNGGPLAGASQPHLHMQFCPFQHSTPPLMQIVATNTRPEVTQDQVVKLNLPWIVYCIKLPSTTTTTTTREKVSPETLANLYSKLLDRSNAYISNLSERVREQPDSGPRFDAPVPPDGPKRRSHNLFLTSTHMFLTPRRSRLVSIERTESIEQGRLSLGGGWEDVEGAEKHMRLSVNGLSVIGYWYVGSKEEERDLKEYGLERTLKECGYVNEDYR